MWWIKPDHLVEVAVIGCGVLVLVAACTMKLNLYSILVTWEGGGEVLYRGHVGGSKSINSCSSKQH